MLFPSLRPRLFFSDGEPWDPNEFMAKLSSLMQSSNKIQCLYMHSHNHFDNWVDKFQFASMQM